jgi:hypothetical protein
MLVVPEERPMSTDPKPTQPAPSPVGHGRRFKHRELELPDGSKLVLNADGTIAQVDAEGGSTVWQPTDAEWASHAIRFGLFPQDATVPPTGRYLEGIRPPRR